MKCQAIARVIAAALTALVFCVGAGAATTAQETATVSASRAGLPPDFNRVFTHGYAEANGIRLHYVSGGPAAGPVVVLLHGWPHAWYTWRWVMPALAQA